MYILSNSPALRKRYINPSHYYYMFFNMLPYLVVNFNIHCTLYYVPKCILCKPMLAVSNVCMEYIIYMSRSL